MSFENKNLNGLSSRQVIDSEGTQIGRIRDAVINKEKLSIHGLCIHGSLLEEKLEDLRLKKDIDPFITLDNVISLTDSSIVINQSKNDLLNTHDIVDNENKILFSQLKQNSVKDRNGKHLGVFTDIIFEKNQQIAYQLGGKEFLTLLNNHSYTRNLTYIINSNSMKFIKNAFHLLIELKEIERNLKVSMTNIVRDLMIEANRDGIITDEEKVLIDAVVVDLPVYFEALEIALKDNIIDEEEEIALDNLKEKTMKKVYNLAMKNDTITEDERVLIKKIASFMIDRRNVLFWQTFGTSEQ